MRPSVILAGVLVLEALSCAHPGTPADAPLRGSVNGLHFDRTSVTGSKTAMTLSEGTWRGYLENRWFEAHRSGEVLKSSAGDVSVTFAPRAVTVHESGADLVISRLDGGPVPEALLMPLWFATRRGALRSQTVPSGQCVDVEGIGTVLVLTLPRPRVGYGVSVESGCHIQFVEPAGQGAPARVDSGRDLTPGGPAR